MRGVWTLEKNSENIGRRGFAEELYPFFTTKGTRSAGRGLRTVYHAMKNFGGRVDGLSELDKGAGFILTFPVFQPEEQAVPEEPAPIHHAA